MKPGRTPVAAAQFGFPALAAVGVWVPRGRLHTARVLHLVAERSGAIPDGQATTPMVEPHPAQ